MRTLLTLLITFTIGTAQAGLSEPYFLALNSQTLWVKNIDDSLEHGHVTCGTPRVFIGHSAGERLGHKIIRAGWEITGTDRGELFGYVWQWAQFDVGSGNPRAFGIGAYTFLEDGRMLAWIASCVTS